MHVINTRKNGAVRRMLDQNITLSARCTQHNERPLYHYSINKLRTYLNHDHKQYVIVVNSNENEPIKICHSKMVMAFIKLRIIKMVSLGNEPRFRVPRTDSSAMHYRIATVLKCNTNCISLNRICKPCGYVLVLLRFQKFCCQSVFARKTAVFGSVFVCPVFPLSSMWYVYEAHCRSNLQQYVTYFCV